MGVKVVQLTSSSHHENLLASLHDLKLQEHLCDVTVQVEGMGDVQEFRAHQVVLAAISGYFRKVLLTPGATEEKLLLSNMHCHDFSKFLDFAYTGKVEVVRKKIGDVQAMAQFLDCEGLSNICSEALSAGVLQKPRRKRCAATAEAVDELQEADKPEGEEELSPGETEGSKKLLKKRNRQKNIKRPAKKLKLKLDGLKVMQKSWYFSLKEDNENQDEDAGEQENRTEEEDQRGTEEHDMSLEKAASDGDDWECEEDEESEDPHDPLFFLEEEEGKEADEGQSKEELKKASKAQFQCNKCQRTFHYERSYLKHISTYHGVQADIVHRCDICMQTFANRSNLKIHEKHVHSNERQFACDSCSKTFKRKKDVIRHQRQVHERNLQHVCPDCGKTLSSKAALLLHERTHTGSRPYECADCGARFTQNSALKMHRRTHTGEKPYACDECDARFTQKHMLSYHKRSHTGEKPFMCEACGKSFASKEYLKHHSNIHTGFKPYKCVHCGRGFAQRNSLNQHLKIHTGERPYCCKDCDKKFTQLNALQRHQRIHTGEKPYMCGLCKRTFTDKSTFRRHTLVHDTDSPWKTYLVQLEGNLEERKPRSFKGEKAEKVEPGEKKSTPRKSPAAPSPAPVAGSTSSASSADKMQLDSIVVPAEPVTLPSDWTSHGTIALVSHGDLEGITVIHTAVPAGMQLQPIVTSDGTGGSLISLEGSGIPLPFSIPVSVKHPVSLTSTAPSAPLSVATISGPVSEALLQSVTDVQTGSTSSAPDSTPPAPSAAAGNQHRSSVTSLGSDVQVVIVGDEACGNEKSGVQSDAEEL
ncbi:GDNF-inducible zinc finger protein 1 [Oryzias latipes]|uniref:GDNF inducible zinc finger protein 1 n=1 Tax=Oryzias latipes TaxID=8090 RepID=H2M2B5_ORYLA|nr:GDNF-inducible zinc finger protein 1 [Oryzias latipes]XP_011489738.1 GDNF-inducible zinc finger protein 1 [Oryzias latipes]XP_020570157.1 GDNF-inducible zinc finger protein 1 [Oryzias latipes]